MKDRKNDDHQTELHQEGFYLIELTVSCVH
jgi:hypothetical protein